jgi:proline dehydrogenase
MPLARSLLLAAAGSDTLHAVATRSRVVRRATRAFMPGESPEDALEAAEALAADGRILLLTRLGEALESPAEAEGIRDHYLELLDEVARRRLPAEISVKPTQLGMERSESRCLEHTLAVAARAEATGSTLWIDMEDAYWVDPTLELYEAVKAAHPRTGLALQAYLRRTPDDLERLAPLDPVIRLVKGAYAEPPEVAFPVKADTDRAFESLALRMLALVRDAKAGDAKLRGGDGAARGAPRAVFGTHDLPLIRRIAAGATSMDVGPGDWEVHMLYGIRAAQQTRLREEGLQVGTLISYGAAWYRWYMRRLAERPANVWFVARSLFG